MQITTITKLPPKTVKGSKKAKDINKKWYVLSRLKLLSIRNLYNKLHKVNQIILALFYAYKNNFS